MIAAGGARSYCLKDRRSGTKRLRFDVNFVRRSSRDDRSLGF